MAGRIKEKPGAGISLLLYDGQIAINSTYPFTTEVVERSIEYKTYSKLK